MATRTIEDKRDRIATILVAPFMTCSARFTLYADRAGSSPTTVLGGFLGLRAAVMLGLYVLGFVAALVTARLAEILGAEGQRYSFMLELPQYRWPTLRSLALRLVDRARSS